MAFIIIDLEFNNLVDIKKYNPDIYEKNPYLEDIEIENEIIEIGAIKLDNYMKPIKEIKTFIKPTVIKVLNPKVAEITHITEENLESGVRFFEGMDMLKGLVDEGDIICSWAKDDIIHIINNSIYHEYKDLKWLENYLDIQEYSTKILGKKKSISLKAALDEFKIKVDNDKLHDALNDAIYTSLVFKRIYNFRAVKGYIIKDIFNMPALEIKNLNEYEPDKSKIGDKCPKCGIRIELEEELIPIKWRYMSIGACTKCKNKVLNEVILKKSISENVVYKEVATIIDEIDYIKYLDRFKKIKLKLNKTV